MTAARTALEKLGVICSVAGLMTFGADQAARAAEPSRDVWTDEMSTRNEALAEQRALLEETKRQIAQMEAQIAAAQETLASLKAQHDILQAQTPSADAGALIATKRELRAPQADASFQTAATDARAGQAPSTDVSEAVLPQGVSILTPPGGFVVDSALTYTQSSNDRLVFRGVEIVPGVQVGLIDANKTRRDQVAAIQTVRVGIAPRFEVEAVVPYLYGQDRVTETVQRDRQATTTTNLDGAGLGDVELTGRYQITDGRDGQPIIVGNLRVKPPTGKGPFDVDYDKFGTISNLPTGSGFWGVEPSISALLRTDPAVIFATVGYLHNFERSIDKVIGSATVGNVEPGGSLNLSLGFALALNQQFSVSLGFKDSHIFPTSQYINGVEQKSQSLQVGALLMGLSYRLGDNLTIAQNLEFGVTSDAPDFTWSIHLPFAF